MVLLHRPLHQLADLQSIHSEGEISFHTDTGVTQYHGDFTEDLYARSLVFTFNWQGDQDNMKTAVVFPFGKDLNGNRIYRGKDSNNRCIEVIEKCTYAGTQNDQLLIWN